MNKTNTWAITLLLAIMVPFATGCDKSPCEYARQSRDEAELIGDTISNARDHGNLTGAQCTTMIGLAAALTDRESLEKMHHKYCNDGPNYLCQSATAIRVGAHHLQEQIADACRSRNEGGNLGQAGMYSENSGVLIRRLRDATNTLDSELAPNGAILTANACDNPNEPAEHALSRRPVQENTVAPAMAYNRDGSGTSSRPVVIPAGGDTEAPTPGAVGGSANIGSSQQAPLPGAVPGSEAVQVAAPAPTPPEPVAAPVVSTAPVRAARPTAQALTLPALNLQELQLNPTPTEAPAVERTPSREQSHRPRAHHPRNRRRHIDR